MGWQNGLANCTDIIGRTKRAKEGRPVNGDKIVCRCEEVLESEIQEAIASGARTLSGIKVRTRAGMGLCQGRICQRLIAGLLAQETGQPLGEIELDTYRPPCRPIKLGAFLGEEV